MYFDTQAALAGSHVSLRKLEWELVLSHMTLAWSGQDEWRDEQCQQRLPINKICDP